MPKHLKHIIQFAIFNFLMISVFMVVAAKKNAENKVILATYNKQQAEQRVITAKQQIEVEAQPDAVVPEAIKPDPFAELPNHNSQADCWISYDGHIYDITSYFGSHPGGDALLIKYCGADATKAFNTKDREPPRSHSVNATNMLKDYLVY
jgi:cytochrome b involved in lipid metabolism